MFSSFLLKIIKFIVTLKSIEIQFNKFVKYCNRNQLNKHSKNLFTTNKND